MEPIVPPNPIEPMDTAAAARTTRLGGVSRGLATIGLSLGLMAVGGAAAVMAASPGPSASTSPGTTPSTQPSTTDDDATTGRAKGPCPEGADGETPSDGQTPSPVPSTDPTDSST